jgi:hypothetical protein
VVAQHLQLHLTDGVSDRYTFVPSACILNGLREQNRMPVDVEEQRIARKRGGISEAPQIPSG